MRRAEKGIVRGNHQLHIPTGYNLNKVSKLAARPLLSLPATDHPPFTFQLECTIQQFIISVVSPFLAIRGRRHPPLFDYLLLV